MRFILSPSPSAVPGVVEYAPIVYCKSTTNVFYMNQEHRIEDRLTVKYTHVLLRRPYKCPKQGLWYEGKRRAQELAQTNNI